MSPSSMSAPLAITWELLNAYVDNELDAAQAAEVASAIARDSALAARVASLAQLKAATKRVASEDETSFAFVPRRQVMKPSLAWAASLFIAVALSATVWWIIAPVHETDHGGAPLRNAQQAWLERTANGGNDGTISISLPATVIATVPDLTAAGLRLASLSGSAEDRRSGGLLADYVGPHGCRLGLWISRQEKAAPDTAPARQDDQTSQISLWLANGRAYALFSHGMNANRFDRYAEIIARLTKSERIPDPTLTLALREASTIGEPCES